MHIIISHTYSTNGRVTLKLYVWTSGGLSIHCGTQFIIIFFFAKDPQIKLKKKKSSYVYMLAYNDLLQSIHLCGHFCVVMVVKTARAASCNALATDVALEWFPYNNSQK